MPIECDMTAKKRKKCMSEDPEQKGQREAKAMDFINFHVNIMKVTESMLEDGKEDWCKNGPITRCKSELGRLLNQLHGYRLMIDAVLDRIEKENMRIELMHIYEDLQDKLVATYELHWENLAQVLPYLTTLLETNENADKLYEENMERCWNSSEKLRKLDYEYNWKGNDKRAKLQESRELQEMRGVAIDFLDSFECLRSFLSKCPIVWKQMFGLSYHVQTNRTEVLRVCGIYPALRYLLVREKADHKTWSCACRTIEESKKNSEVEGRPVVVKNEE